jgi:colicin import membrane protein
VRETRADTRVAFVAALALHALLFALLFVGMRWTRAAAPASAAGPEIEADLVDPNALSAPLRRALDAPAQPEPEPTPPEPVEATPPPQPEPEPRPEDSQVAPQPQAQAPVPVPDTREQERVEREAEAARQAAREQEEKRRQEQIDLTERKRQEEAEKKQRLAQQQEIARKLEKIRAEREKAKRAADLAEQKLKQIADAQKQAAQPAASTTAPPPGNNGADDGLAARYRAALTAAITQNWTRPDSVPLGQRCVINIRQIPGGQVISAKVDPSCPYDEPGRRSIEAAVLKAQPLPYAGFEPVFNRDLRLNFEARDR